MNPRRRKMIRRSVVQLPASFCRRGPGIAPMAQILIERSQFLVIHSSYETPRHLLSQMMAIGVRASAHRGDELLALPLLHEIQTGPDGSHLTWLTAVQVGAVALTTILIT